MSRLGNLGARLHRGEAGFDFVGKRLIWYGVSLLITVLAFTGLAARGLHMGVEFEGGAVFTTQQNINVSVEHAREAAEEVSGSQAIVQELGGDALRIQVSGLDTAESDRTREALAEDFGVATEEINAELVGPSWGSQIAGKAWQGLGIFMVLVVIYLAIAFEWRMALAALIALVHDLTITVGVYAIVGFEVTPGTVIGLLTILGYSLYDTVVVFDGLKEATRGITKQSRYTYAELANRSLNGTLVRSVNTTVVALLPVAGLLFIGGGLLGGGMLNDIALSLFVGLSAGAYSSIMIATPLVADLKMRQGAIKANDKRVLARRAKAGAGPGSGDGGENGGENGNVTGAEGTPSAEDTVPHTAPAAAAVVGQRPRQSGNRGRGRPSGRKR